MGSECNTPSRRHYDITMSKRTRKQQQPPPLMNLLLQDPNSHSAASSKCELNGLLDVVEESSPKKVGDDEENDSKMSLKQLIKGDGGDAEESEGNAVRSGVGRGSLSHHFNEEEKQSQSQSQLQLQVAKTHQNEGVSNLKGMVSRYAKVLSHLVKMKREPRLASRKKKQLLRLTT